MLKNQYTLIQKGLCSEPGNFQIVQGLPQVSEGQSFNHLNTATEMTSGQFKQSKSCSLLNCCSCRTIKQLSLTLYGQIISKAHIDSCFNLFPCLISQQLVVTTLSEILIGKIRKQNCMNNKILRILDAQQKTKFWIVKNECQCISYLPRFLRCGKTIKYEIMNEKQQVVGQIINKQQGFIHSLCTNLDTFEISFPTKDSKDKDKDRILLMNAVVYLDIVKHEFF